MSTPPFSSASSSFDEVRLYTEFDPYYYITDNRPIQDIAGNTSKMADAADAGRSAAAIGAISESAYNAGAHGFSDKTVGLSLTNPSVGVVSLLPGTLLTKQAINSGDSREILKKASLPYTISLNTPHPISLGKEVYHLVQVKYRDFGPTTVFPYYIAPNEFSESSMVNGWLEATVVTGNEMDIGFATPPIATAGHTPLWLVKTVAGSTDAIISEPAGALPRSVNLVNDAPAALLSSSGYQRMPSGIIMQWATAASVAAGGTGSVTFPIPFPTAALFAIANTTASAGSATPSNIVAGTPTTTAVPIYNLGTAAGVAKVFAMGY